MRFKKQEGFSLVELMVVVGIIGILATLAMPRFKQFQAKAKMGEAKNLLSHIYTLESSYALDTNQFIAFGPMGAGLTALSGSNVCANANAATLGFTIDPCVVAAPTPRYSYNVVLGATNSFVAYGQTGATANNRVCQNNVAHYISVDSFNGAGSGTTVPAAPATTASILASIDLSVKTLSIWKSISSC